MSIPVPVLLTFLALAACRGHRAALPQTSNFLKESIRLLSHPLRLKASCDKMNVTNIFAGEKKNNATEILHKTTAVLCEVWSCHPYLEGVYLNLLSLVQGKSPVHRSPCPVVAGNTTSLNNFLVYLHRVLQRLVKDGSLK